MTNIGPSSNFHLRINNGPTSETVLRTIGSTRLAETNFTSTDIPILGEGGGEVEGSLLVVTKNGTLELQSDSIEVVRQPDFGVLDEDLIYSSPLEFDDSYELRATTADGKTTVDITIFLSPSTDRYTVAYVGSTEDYGVLANVELTDISGLIDGDLTLSGIGWQCPIQEVDPNVVILGSGCDLSESTWVFQGPLDEDNSRTIVEWFKNDVNRFREAYLFPDNSLLGDGVGVNSLESNGYQYCSTFVAGGWRWREFVTGAAVGAVVGGVIGSIVPGPGTVAGAFIGGAIGGGLLGGGTAVVVDVYVDPNNEENNYVNSGISGVVGGVGGGYVGGVVGGIITAPAIPAVATLPAIPESGYVVGWIYRGKIVAAQVGGTHAGAGTGAGVVSGGSAIPGAVPFTIVNVGGVPTIGGSVGFGGFNSIPAAARLIVRGAFGI